MPLHSGMTSSTGAIHPAAYVQSTDPGAVGADKQWVDISTGAGTVASPYPVKKRNTANTAWEYIGTCAVTATQSANTVLSGPTSGSAAVPTFRALVAADLPSRGGVLLRLSGDQAITTATATALNWGTEDLDSNAQHFTSTANLTGTVAKTSGSAVLVGTGSSFTTELSVGQVISVPGTATEVKVVTVVTDNTHVTVNSNYANTASGQTAARLSSPVVFPVATLAIVNAGILWDTSATGNRTIEIRLNGATILAGQGPYAATASQEQTVACLVNAAQWDYIEVVVTQTSGGTINAKADQRTRLGVTAV
jgi:hypothetical protein